jgi:hypothetical protein
MVYKKENRLEIEPILLPINSHENKNLYIVVKYFVMSTYKTIKLEFI